MISDTRYIVSTVSSAVMLSKYCCVIVMPCDDIYCGMLILPSIILSDFAFVVS